MCNDLVSFRPSVHLRSKTLGYDEARRASRIPRAKKNKPFACSIGGFFFSWSGLLLHLELGIEKPHVSGG